MALDLSKLGPNDIAATMRSLPRRFREALAVRDDEDQDTLANVVGPDGLSALDHVANTGRMLALFNGALTEVTNGRQPVLHAAITDPSARAWEHSAADLDGELALLDDEAASMADRVERTSAVQWQEVGRVVGGSELTALDLAKEAVQVAIPGIEATSAAMHHARTH